MSFLSIGLANGVHQPSTIIVNGGNPLKRPASEPLAAGAPPAKIMVNGVANGQGGGGGCGITLPSTVVVASGGGGGSNGGGVVVPTAVVSSNPISSASPKEVILQQKMASPHTDTSSVIQQIKQTVIVPEPKPVILNANGSTAVPASTTPSSTVPTTVIVNGVGGANGTASATKTTTSPRPIIVPQQQQPTAPVVVNGANPPTTSGEPVAIGAPPPLVVRHPSAPSSSASAPSPSAAPAGASKATSATPFVCEWQNCGQAFKSPATVEFHAIKAHCGPPATSSAVDLPCLWARCDGMKRKRFSLITHLQNQHCHPQVRKATFCANMNKFLMSCLSFPLDNEINGHSTDSNGHQWQVRRPPTSSATRPSRLCAQRCPACHQQASRQIRSAESYRGKLGILPLKVLLAFFDLIVVSFLSDGRREGGPSDEEHTLNFGSYPQKPSHNEFFRKKVRKTFCLSLKHSLQIQFPFQEAKSLRVSLVDGGLE